MEYTSQPASGAFLSANGTELHNGMYIANLAYPQLTNVYNRFCSERSPLPRKMYNRFDSVPGASAGRSFTTGR